MIDISNTLNKPNEFGESIEEIMTKQPIHQRMLTASGSENISRQGSEQSMQTVQENRQRGEASMGKTLMSSRHDSCVVTARVIYSVLNTYINYSLISFLADR
jgi:hypothetical protein